MLLAKIINVDAVDLRQQVLDDLKNWQFIHYLLKQAKQHHQEYLQDIDKIMKSMATASTVDGVLTTLHDAVDLLYRMKSAQSAPIVKTSLPSLHT